MPNCKVGDLVRYCGDNKELNRPNVYGWIGKVVRQDDWEGLTCWRVSPPLPGGSKVLNQVTYPPDWCADRSLRPIRGQEGQDEILRIVGKPVKEKELV